MKYQVDTTPFLDLPKAQAAMRKRWADPEYAARYGGEDTKADSTANREEKRDNNAA